MSAIKPSSESSILQSVTCHIGYLKLGLLYFKTKQYNQAINTFEKILVLEPNNFDAHYYLGNIYLEKGDFKSAKDAFQKAASISPDNWKVCQILNQVDRELISSTNLHPNYSSDSKSPQLLLREQVLTSIPVTIQKIYKKIIKSSKLIIGISISSISSICIILFSLSLIRYLLMRSLCVNISWTLYPI